MKEPLFQGSCTAIITPFTQEGIDFGLLKAQLDYQAQSGTKAIVVAGTTGENAVLQSSEYFALVEKAIDAAEHRMKVIVGIGGNCTAHCAEKAKFSEHAGADGILMTTPYYNKTTQSGLVRHFLTVADAVSTPLILYNVPSRTAIGINAETYQTLSDHPNINGVKEASGDFSLIARITAECGDALNIWSGNDDQTIPMMALGAKGVVSVASNLVPLTVNRICENCLCGDYAAARRIFRRYAGLFRLLFCETNPIPIKAAMQICGLDSGTLRLPLVSISGENLTKLQTELKKLSLLT